MALRMTLPTLTASGRKRPVDLTVLTKFSSRGLRGSRFSVNANLEFHAPYQ